LLTLGSPRLERAREHEENIKYVQERGPLDIGKVIQGRFSKGIHHENEKKAGEAAAQRVIGGSESDEKGVVVSSSDSIRVTEEEWATAARALKTASWGTM